MAIIDLNNRNTLGKIRIFNRKKANVDWINILKKKKFIKINRKFEKIIIVEKIIL